MGAAGDVAHRGRWHRRLDAVCADPEALRLVLHPVVDVAAGRVAGYEVLSRFASDVPTEQWFRAARALGRDADLDRVVLDGALRLLPDLPPGTFLTVNASPTSLADQRVLDVLTSHDLTGVVLELTEHADCDPAQLTDPLRMLRARGRWSPWTTWARATRGCCGWPSCVRRSSRWTCSWSATCTATSSSARSCSSSASAPAGWTPGSSPRASRRSTSWTCCAAWASPLVQGFLLARPQEDFVQLGAEARRLLEVPQAAQNAHAADAFEGPEGHRRSRAAAGRTRRARDLTRRTKTDRSVGDALRSATEQSAPSSSSTPTTCPGPGAAGRASRRAAAGGTGGRHRGTRDGRHRRRRPRRGALGRGPLRPLVCTDAAGRYVGVVGVEDLVLDLAVTSGGVAAPQEAGGWRMGA